MAMSKREVLGRHVKMARAAIDLTIREFADFVGIAANTISRIELGLISQRETTDAIEERLKSVPGLEWLPDVGGKIGVRVQYDILPHSFPKAEKLRAIKGGPIDEFEFERGSIGSDYPEKKWKHKYAGRKKEYGPDKRVGKRSRGSEGSSDDNN